MNAKEFRTQWILDPSKEMIIEHEIMEAYHRYKSKSKLIVKPKQTIEERRADFRIKLNVFFPEYSKEELYKFDDYWSEGEGRLMRCELAKNKPFSMKRRLRRFRDKNNNKTQTSASENLINKLKL